MCLLHNSLLLLANICRSYPNIDKGSRVYDPRSGFVNYTCDEGFYMPTLNVTSVQIVCSCSSIGNATDVENCTGKILIMQSKNDNLFRIAYPF